jgi:hypothetical protein
MADRGREEATMSTTTTDPTTVDVDLDTGPVCQMKRCPSGNGPAVAVAVHYDLCEHAASVLVCQECMNLILEGWNSSALFECSACCTIHPCWLRLHVRIVPL